jgi:patatin-like phospholipase/acyl hydrolase
LFAEYGLLEEIGRRPFGRLRKNLASLAGPKYKAKGLEDLLSMCFDDDTLLSSTLTSVIIPSFDIKLQQPIFFSSWKVFMPFLPSNIYQLKQGHAFSLPKLTGLDS